MTNKAGTWTRADYVNGTNEGTGLPQLQPMSTGGAFHKLVDESSNDYFIEAIHPNEFILYTPETHPWLFYTPTVSGRYWVERERKDNPNFINDGHPDKTTPKQEWFNEPMHFYDEEIIMAVFGFIPNKNSSTGWVNRIPKFRCRVLGSTEAVPNPFIMRFGRTRANPYEGF